MITLGIESSCDEMSAAVLADGVVLANVISSQMFHSSFGGVVPELASREHTRTVVPVVHEALRQAGVSLEAVDLCAATQGPGLIGSLLVGLNFSKAFAWACGIPFLPINHIEAHVFSTFLSEQPPAFPFLVLVVSGGHTLLLRVETVDRFVPLGTTIDDAAGEAFDKVAKMLGLPYPGGPEIERRARSGDAGAFPLPRPLMHSDDLNFSFSGLKTAVLYQLRDRGFSARQDGQDSIIDNMCASFQEAVVDVLSTKALRAAQRHQVRDIAVTGGVSANGALRERIRAMAAERGFRVHIPELRYSTDNAAMVAAIAERKFTLGAHGSYHAQAYSRVPAFRA